MNRFIFFLFGIVFGYILIMSGVSNYDVIREMFLFQSFHLYGVLCIAVGLAFIFNYFVKKLKIRSLLNKEPIDMTVEVPKKHHLIGGVIAGLGWAITGACPGPALAQIGYGTLSGLFTLIGIFVGVYLYGQKTLFRKE